MPCGVQSWVNQSASIPRKPARGKRVPGGNAEVEEGDTDVLTDGAERKKEHE